MSQPDLTKMLLMIKNGIDKTQPLIKEIEELRKSKLVVLFCGDDSIDHVMCYRLLKILRQLGTIEKLDLFIDSGGGDIDAACKMVKILKQYSKSFSIVIPYMAKSAATLLALNAEEVVMCKAGELGVADPQVREPITGIYVPAHSIKEAIDFIEEIKDPYVKLSLTDKLPPLLIGAFRDAQSASKQYVEESLSKLASNKEEATHMFTQKYLSHGYPIDRDLCKQAGLNVVFPSAELEKRLGDLFEIYGDMMLNAVSNFKVKSFSVLQANSNLCVMINGNDITSRFKAFEGQIDLGSETSGE
jgi:hypothetical protein